MILVAGCSKSHHTPLAAAKMHNIMHLDVMMLPSCTFWESARPKGRELLRNVLPRDLGWWVKGTMFLIYAYTLSCI